MHLTIPNLTYPNLKLTKINMNFELLRGIFRVMIFQSSIFCIPANSCHPTIINLNTLTIFSTRLSPPLV